MDRAEAREPLACAGCVGADQRTHSVARAAGSREASTRECVLIHGGAGAVGVFAIQLAHRQGAYVITTVSARSASFVRELVADQVIDYKAVPFEKEAGQVGVVFDAVGGETLRRSWNVLKPSGHLVTIASPSEIAPDERTKAAFFIVEPKREQLMEVGGCSTRGSFEPS
jgi:NADPH:quinone reductase-like Zn-dependent oxidoreductase